MIRKNSIVIPQLHSGIDVFDPHAIKNATFHVTALPIIRKPNLTSVQIVLCSALMSNMAGGQMR